MKNQKTRFHIKNVDTYADIQNLYEDLSKLLKDQEENSSFVEIVEWADAYAKTIGGRFLPSDHEARKSNISTYESLIASRFDLLERLLINFQENVAAIQANSQKIKQLAETMAQELQLKTQLIAEAEAEVKTEREKLARATELTIQKQKEYQNALQAKLLLIKQMPEDQKSFTLQEAITGNNQDLIDLFINTDFDLNFQNGHDHNSMLHTAIKYNHTILLGKLLRNIDTLELNKTDVGGKTPLLLAVTKQDFELCFTFIKHRANIYIADKTGNSPYMFIRDKLFADIALGVDNFLKQLLLLPIDLSEFTHKDNNNSPLYEAMIHNQSAIADLLFFPKMIASTVFSAINNDNLTGNHKGDQGYQIIKQLIAKGANKAEFIWHDQPLMLLALKNTINSPYQFIAQLISNDVCDKKALFIAINENNIQVVNYLVAAQKDLLKEQNEQGLNPLMLASCQNKSEIVKVLQSLGGKLIDAISTSVNSPLVNIGQPMAASEIICLQVALKANNNLSTLVLHNSNLSLQDLGYIINVIKYKHINNFTVSKNPLGDPCADLIAGFIKNNNSLQTINISETGITIKGILKIANSLGNNNHLHLLDISKNNLGDSLPAVIAVKKVIYNCKFLYSLNLSQTGLGDNHSAQILEQVAASTSLLDINLSDNKIGASVLNKLNGYLKNNHSLIKINLSNNQKDAQFQLELEGLIKAGDSLLSVGDITPYLEHHDTLNTLLVGKVKTFRENMEFILKEPDCGELKWPLSKLLVTFKQLQYNVITTEGIWEKVKFVFKKIDGLFSRYEHIPDDQEIAEIFSATLNEFRQDYDYLS